MKNNEIVYTEVDTIRRDFSKDSIDRMFRMLNAANSITIGNHEYLKTFCLSPEIRGLIEQMKQSPEVLQMIKRAEKEKEQGQQGRGNSRGLTPAEREHKDAGIAFKKWQKTGYSDDKIFDSIIDSAHMGLGYDTKEDLIDPQKIKKDTIAAKVNISEINKKIKEVKENILNVAKSDKKDVNR